MEIDPPVAQRADQPAGQPVAETLEDLVIPAPYPYGNRWMSSNDLIMPECCFELDSLAQHSWLRLKRVKIQEIKCADLIAFLRFLSDELTRPESLLHLEIDYLKLPLDVRSEFNFVHLQVLSIAEIGLLADANQVILLGPKDISAEQVPNTWLRLKAPLLQTVYLG